LSVESNRALIRRWFDEGNKGKAAAIAVIDKLCASNCILHGSSNVSYNVEEYRKFMNELYSAFPDVHNTIEDMVTEGDKVAVRLKQTYTHKGEFMGVPPTNKKVTMWLIQIYRMAGGKCVEGWSRSDTLGMMQQLGIIPAPKPR
jgi:predicted ester cyclase